MPTDDRLKNIEVIVPSLFSHIGIGREFLVHQISDQVHRLDKIGMIGSSRNRILDHGSYWQISIPLPP